MLYVRVMLTGDVTGTGMCLGLPPTIDHCNPSRPVSCTTKITQKLTNNAISSSNMLQIGWGQRGGRDIGCERSALLNAVVFSDWQYLYPASF